jgi:hypothetical protein
MPGGSVPVVTTFDTADVLATAPDFAVKAPLDLAVVRPARADDAVEGRSGDPLDRAADR